VISSLSVSSRLNVVPSSSARFTVVRNVVHISYLLSFSQSRTSLPGFVILHTSSPHSFSFIYVTVRRVHLPVTSYHFARDVTCSRRLRLLFLCSTGKARCCSLVPRLCVGCINPPAFDCCCLLAQRLTTSSFWSPPRGGLIYNCTIYQTYKPNYSSQT
jgi:hypothetical protein